MVMPGTTRCRSLATHCINCIPVFIHARPPRARASRTRNLQARSAGCSRARLASDLPPPLRPRRGAPATAAAGRRARTGLIQRACASVCDRA
jgi:hypothetical protein